MIDASEVDDAEEPADDSPLPIRDDVLRIPGGAVEEGGVPSK